MRLVHRPIMGFQSARVESSVAFALRSGKACHCPSCNFLALGAVGGRPEAVGVVAAPPRACRHVAVTIRSGQQRIARFRSACDKAMRYVVDQVAFLSLGKSEWAR